MNDFLNFFLDRDNAIIIGLVLVALILIITILILDFKARRKEMLDGDLLSIELPKEEEADTEIKEIKYVEESEELEKTKAKLELENLKAELKKEEEERLRQSEAINKVEPVLEQQQEVIAPPVEEVTTTDVITMEDIVNKAFNDEEENAIISVSELEQKVNTLYDSKEVRMHEDEGNEPISISELEALYKSTNVTLENNIDKDIVKQEVLEPTIIMPEEFTLKEEIEESNEKQETTFTTSPLISPVYGTYSSKENSLDNINLEQTANLDKLNEELKKVNAFLKELKELRNKLQ